MNGFLSPESMAGNVALGVVGLVLLVLAADVAVARLVELAEYFRLSTTFMGMTVVSLATSIPEISAHLTASVGILRGTLDYEVGSAIVLGANIGSDVVQQTLILGLVVFVARQLYFRRYVLWKSLLPMIATALVCIVLGANGTLSRLDGAILFGLFVAYTYYLYWDERKHFRPVPGDGQTGDVAAVQTPRQAIRAALITLGSTVVTLAAAQVVLNTTAFVVAVTGIGGSLIGAVTLGVASALPELVTALSGLRKSAYGITMGTLIGSNITNPLVAFGLGAMVSTYWMPRAVLVWDLPWQAGAGAILWVILWFAKGRLNRKSALYLMTLYAVYVIMRAIFFAVD